MVFIIMQYGSLDIYEGAYYEDEKTVAEVVNRLNLIADLDNQDPYFYMELEKKG